MKKGAVVVWSLFLSSIANTQEAPPSKPAEAQPEPERPTGLPSPVKWTFNFGRTKNFTYGMVYVGYSF